MHSSQESMCNYNNENSTLGHMRRITAHGGGHGLTYLDVMAVFHQNAMFSACNSMCLDFIQVSQPMKPLSRHHYHSNI